MKHFIISKWQSNFCFLKQHQITELYNSERRILEIYFVTEKLKCLKQRKKTENFCRITELQF